MATVTGAGTRRRAQGAAQRTPGTEPQDRPAIPPSLAAELAVREVREALGLTLQEFARLTGFSVRSLSSWEGGDRLGGAGLRRMQEIRALQQALGAVARPGSLGGWLLTPNEAFGGLKPLEVIERGEVHRIWQLLYWLQSGAPS